MMNIANKDIKGKGKRQSSYIVQHPIMRIAQSASYFTSLTDHAAINALKIILTQISTTVHSQVLNTHSCN